MFRDPGGSSESGLLWAPVNRLHPRFRRFRIKPRLAPGTGSLAVSSAVGSLGSGDLEGPADDGPGPVGSSEVLDGVRVRVFFRPGRGPVSSAGPADLSLMLEGGTGVLARGRRVTMVLVLPRWAGIGIGAGGAIGWGG